ncbi:uncharacterized protein [Musca autumnalis]|uniref:uncharacterized protein n=1 Tax=Musca autumnalis TaxID=221902 RepID=UPI003CEBA381
MSISENSANDSLKASNSNVVAQSSPELDVFLFECDHLVNFCQQFDQSDITDQTDSVLQVKLCDLEQRWVNLQKAYRNIMLSPKSSNVKEFKENAKINFNATSEAYYTAKSQIEDILRMSAAHNQQNNGQNVPPASLHQSSLDNSNICIKVPPCDTEIFSGGYEEWPSFRDMFTAVYADHKQLSQAQKLYHLRNKTRGPAGAIVKRFPLCDDNFQLAWNALKSRYENRRVLVDNQLKILFNIPVAKMENSESIQKVHYTVNDCLCTLKTLKVDIESWDPILIYLVSTKLPDETLSLWEQSLKSHRELPTWAQLDAFLINRFEVVERISSIRQTKVSQSSTSNNFLKKQQNSSQEKVDFKCPYCKTNHQIRSCQEFRKLSVQERVDFVVKNNICFNCLSAGHMKQNCKSNNTCLMCHKDHHTLLHINKSSSENFSKNSSHGDSNKKSYNPNHSASLEAPSTSKLKRSSQVQANFCADSNTILLRTALVQIEHMGELFTLRTLIDPGSQRTFISERVRNLLQIPTSKGCFEITGVGGQKQTSEKECELVIVAQKHNIRFSITAIVLPKVAQSLPSVTFEVPNPQALEDIDLADPSFNKSSQIDLILGNDSERFINLEGIKKNICGNASAYNTIFGWVLSGPMQIEQVHSFTSRIVESENHLISNLLRKFWEQEEVPRTLPVSVSDEFCEEFYKKTTTRSSDGRYVVRLPFRNEFSDTLSLGSSRYIALAQYTRLEKTIANNNELATEYNKVLNEYLSLDHMEETSSHELRIEGKYLSFYLPHHAVVRPEHKSTKVKQQPRNLPMCCVQAASFLAVLSGFCDDEGASEKEHHSEIQVLP